MRRRRSDTRRFRSTALFSLYYTLSARCTSIVYIAYIYIGTLLSSRARINYAAREGKRSIRLSRRIYPRRASTIRIYILYPLVRQLYMWELPRSYEQHTMRRAFLAQEIGAEAPQLLSYIVHMDALGIVYYYILYSCLFIQFVY